MDYIVLGSNFALLVKSPGDDGQQLLTTGSRLGMYIVAWTSLYRPPSPQDIRPGTSFQTSDWDHWEWHLVANTEDLFKIVHLRNFPYAYCSNPSVCLNALQISSNKIKQIGDITYFLLLLIFLWYEFNYSFGWVILSNRSAISFCAITRITSGNFPFLTSMYMYICTRDQMSRTESFLKKIARHWKLKPSVLAAIIVKLHPERCESSFFLVFVKLYKHKNRVPGCRRGDSLGNQVNSAAAETQSLINRKQYNKANISTC